MKKIVAPVYSYKQSDSWLQFNIKKWDYRKEHIMHFHDCLEILIMLQGTGTQLLNGTECAIDCSTITCLFINDYHAIYNLSKDSIIYNLMINPSMISQKHLDKLNNMIGFNKHCSLSEMTYKQLKSLFEFLEYTTLCEQVYDNDFYSCIVNNLLEIFFNNFNYDLPKNRTISNNHWQNIIFYINMHLLEDLSIEKVANEAGYSVGYFSHYFHKVLGVRFKDYITKLRIEYAKSLLNTTDYSISKIAFDSGFSSIPTFMRNFSHIVGKSPNQYRKTYLTKKI